MTFQPAHKDCDRPAGQIVNDITLADYIERKQQDMNFNEVAKEKKLTFDEWLKTTNITPNDTLLYNWGITVWKAAQENV